MTKNMKKIFQYMAALLLILTVGSSCEDNDNWTIVTAVQPGTYITGDALIYSAVASSASLKAADLDNAPEGTNVTGIYTWIKAGAGFTILKVDAEGNEVSYGKGGSVASSPFETVSLEANGSAFSVTADGLYYVVLNNADNQVTVIPAQFGIIGDATSGGWDSETVMTQSFDENQALVEMVLKNAPLDKKSMKFRYHDWGIEIPYSGGTAKFHSNVGAMAAGDITAAFSECKGGGDNFSVAQKNTYDVTLQLDLRTGVFKAKIVATGEAPEEPEGPEIPENMFMIGSAWDWNWDNVNRPMVKVTEVDGRFWAVKYFAENEEFKFSPVKAWAGSDFGFGDANLSDESVSLAGLSDQGGNIKVGIAGWYIVSVTTSETDGTYAVEFLKPEIWLVGGTALGEWSPGSNAGDLFTPPTIATGVFTSPAFNAAGALRMCVLLPGTDWWRTEFNVIDGKIAYRENGGEQSGIPEVAAGQTVSLNFSDGTGIVQ